MNRKSSLYPGANGTGVGGTPRGGGVPETGPPIRPCGSSRKRFLTPPAPLPGPTLRFQPQAFLWNPPPPGVPPTPVPSTPGYSELLRFIKNRFLKERHPTVRRISAGGGPV